MNVNNFTYYYKTFLDSLPGDCIKPLVYYSGFFVIKHIETREGCQKVAWIIAHIATGIFAYPVLVAVASLRIITVIATAVATAIYLIYLQIIEPNEAIRFQRALIEFERQQGQLQSESLETAMTFWLNEYQTQFPRLCTENQSDLNQYESLLTHPNHDRLHRFLDKLTTTEDFKQEESRNALIYRVVQMLKGASTNASFREGFFANIAEALDACGDRTAVYLNQIEILWHCSQVGELSDEEMIKVLVGVKRIGMLRTIATERMNQLHLGLGYNIEVHLYYQVKLKEELELPVSTEGMLYGDLVSYNITPEILAEDKAQLLQATSTPEQKAAILVMEETWIKRIQEANQDQFEQINNAALEEIAQIDPTWPEQQILEKTKELTEKRNQKTQELIYKLTLEYFFPKIKDEQDPSKNEKDYSLLALFSLSLISYYFLNSSTN